MMTITCLIGVAVELFRSVFSPAADVEVAWNGGGRLVCTGNSFATPHIAGIAALVLSKHPELTPFQLKSLLYLTATNVGGGK